MRLSPCWKKALGVFLVVPLLLFSGIGEQVSAAPPEGFYKESLLNKKLDPSTLTRLLKQGELVLINEPSGDRPLTVTAALIIDAPPERVWETVFDFSSYSDFYPGLEEIEVEARTDKGAEVKYSMRFTLFSLISTIYTYKVFISFERPRRATFEMEEGDIGELFGRYEFLPLERGKKTILFYTVWKDYKSLGFLVRTLLEQQPSMEIGVQVSEALEVVKVFKERVRKVMLKKKLLDDAERKQKK